jgi:PQ loop repeat
MGDKAVDVVEAGPLHSLYASLFTYLALGCAFALVPQIVLILKTKQVGNISIPLFVLWTLGKPTPAVPIYAHSECLTTFAPRPAPTFLDR